VVAGRPVAALSLPCPVVRVDEEGREFAVVAVVATARETSAALNA
jgi:hypothetical protein